MKATLQLDKLLKKHRLTLRALSTQTGISTQALSGLKNQKASRIELRSVAEICKALSCTPNDLIHLHDSNKD